MKFIERLSRKSAQQLQPVEPGQAPMLMALEPRIMFDASVGVVAQEAAAQTTADAVRVSTSSNETSQTPAAAADTSSQQQGTQRQEVVFVDGQVNDTAQLLAGLSGTAEVVILDPSKDGLQQMADYLKGREGLDAIHLLSHGADGTVQTGNVWLASNNLAEHSEALVSIGSALKADGDLMLYGCDVGEGEKGQAFLDQLAAITGADVAASIDDTGAAALGGNWALERSSGAIETAALSVSGYDSLMAQNYTGGTNATAPLLSAGNSLMRSVVGDFNNDGRADILYQGSGANAPWNLALGNADGTFSVVSQTTSPFAGVTLLDAATGGSNYHAADFDGDGDTDLMVAAVSGSQVLLYRNNGSSFTSEDITNGNAPVFGVRSIAGDFNADGAVDLLYQTNSTSGSPWRVKLNNGNGTFVDVLSTDALSPFKNVTLSDFLAYNYKVADVDGDGDSDLMYALQNTQLQYLRNDNGVFTTVAGNLNLPVTPVNRVVLGDFDGDGDADVIYQTSGNGSAWRYARNDGTTFTDMAITSSPFAGVTLADMGNQQYRMGDFDGDGDLDIFVASSTLSSVYFQGGSSPQLASATPADNSLSVSPTANIVLTFNDVVTKGTGNIYIVRTSDNTVVQTIAVGSSAVTGSGTTWTIDPPADLAQGVAYAIRIDNKTFANADGKVYAGIRNNVALNFVTSSNAAPVITNLNGDAVSYTEGSAGVLLDSSTNTTVTDTDSANFNGGNVTVSISNNGVTSEDELWISGQGAGATNINVSGSNITYGNDLIGTYTGGTLGNPLVISLNSAATPVAVSALLQRLAYRNSNDADITPSTRTVQVTVNDGTGGTSTAASVTLSVVAVNDAPTLTATATNPTFTENGTGSTLFSGAAISTIEAGQSITGLYVQVSNLGNGNLEKLIIDGTAVTLVDQTSVTTSTNGLSVSVAVSSTTATVSITHAGLSTALAQTLVNGMAYRNDSESPTGASRTAILIGVRDSGGTSSGGSNAGIVSIASTVTVVSVNDAPTLSGGPFVLASINENTATNGYLVSTVLGSVTYGDLDTSAQTGIAVTATSGRGFWQYSTDGSNWTDIGTVSSSAALLLDSTSQVRYIPDSANSENVNFTFRAWDRTTGTASTTGNRSTVDTTTNGGSTAFSTGTAQATLVVTSVNDAPVLTPVAPSLSALTDTSTTNTGDLVSALTAGITDVDTGAVQGIAITGLTSTYGTWQYSTNGGSTWSNVDTVATTSALMLRSSDRVRFIPDGINGEIATITYKAWDQSGATSGLQGAKINVTTSGAATPFSTATDTASVVVTAVNDAPTLTGTGGSVAWTEGNNVTSTPVVIDSGLTLSDADGPGIASATVRVSGNYSNSQDVLALVSDTATMGNIIGSWNATTGILNLSSAGNLASQAQWQAALRSVTYTNLSDSPTTTTRTLEFVVTDGGGASAAAVTRSLTLTAVDDSPVITAASSTQVVEDVASAINQISLSDVDSSSGTVTLSVGAGSLAATSGSGVTVGGTSSALTLTGTLTNISTFIANNGLTYTTVANVTADETLTIRVDTASASTDSTSMTLSVNPVNDAPVVTVPASISVTEDVPGALTGISFSDIDAGSASVTATFSVPSGTLTATSGSGVTVLGSGTGALSLSGSLSDINAFIAASSVSFQTALDNTSTVTLTVSINDNGNTGGSAQTDSKNVSLLVSAVNDAPVNSVPVSQSVPQDSVLTFSTANNNAIVVSDVDVGSNQIAVSLAATNGRVTLATLANLTLTLGSGTNDTSVWFSGSLADVNAALDGLIFTPTAGYNGAASLQIVSSDNGNSGSGVTRTDTDAIAITVAPLNPTVTHVSVVQANGAYKAGETLDVTVTFDMAVDVAGGIPTLLLETGLTDRLATYVSGSGSNTLTFAYTVQAGDVSADLDYASTTALQLNGATIKSVSNDNAALVLPTLGGSDSIAGQKAIVIDGVVPSISSVAAPVDGTYITGQNLDFTISFSETVQVNTAGGTPRLAVTLDTGGTVYASYVSGAGSNALVFRLTAASGQLDSNGIVLGGALLLNGGSIRDTAGNDTQLTLNNVASTANVIIDGVVPVVVSVTPPADGSYKTGDTLSFTVNASEAVQTGALAPRLVLDVGGVTRYATYVSGSGSAALVFQYVVQAGDTDSNGIAVNSLDLRGDALTDVAGNDLNLTLNSVGSTAGVLVDTTAPSASGIVRVDTSPTNSGAVSFTVSFSENVSGVGVSDFSLSLTGNASGSIASVTQVDARTYTVRVDTVSGVGSLRLDLKASGTGIVDAAGNAITGGLIGTGYVIDRVAPSVTRVDVPADGTYVAGQALDFTVNLDEAVLLDTTGGTPRLAITLGTGGTVYASYLSGAGTDALVFRLTVASGQLDTNGISVGNNLQLNGATLRDSVGNDVNTTLNGLGSTTGVLVDAIMPVVGSVGLPADGSYNTGDVLSFTVNTSEGVVVDTTTGTPRLVLTVGSATRYASYVSGATSGALVFQYTVQAGDTAASGLGIGSTLDLNGGSVRDAAGNNLTLNLNGLGSAAGVLVDTTAPTANSIALVDTDPTTSSTVNYTVTFSEAVSGVDSGDFALAFTGGVSGRIASVTQVDARTYRVQVDSLTGNGSVRLDLNSSGTGIVDAAGNTITGGLTGASYTIDRVAPGVVSVDVPANGTYVAGQNLDFTVNFSETVTVDTTSGAPRIAVTLDTGGTVYADYVSGSGSNALVFRLTAASGQLDSNGITLGSSLDLNGSRITDLAGNSSAAGLNGVASTAGVNIDGVVPTVLSVGTPVADLYNAGDVLTFTVKASEALQTGTPAPRLALDVGGVSRYATYVSGSGSDTLVFQYVVQAGDTDSNGIAMGRLDLRGGALTDVAGNNLNLTLNNIGDLTGVLVDTTAPTANSIALVDTNPTTSSTVNYTVTFSEAVSGVDSGDFALAFTGGVSGRIASVTQVDARTYRVQVDSLTGNGSVRLDLNSSGTGIVDAAGNTITGGLTGASYTIDRVAPGVVSVDVPANGTYVAGQNLDFTVNFSEAVQVDTTGGTPRIEVTLDTDGTAYATYLSGAGTDTLVFRLTVASGQLDTTGISVGNSFQLNGGAVRDSVGNNVATALNGLGDTSGVRVDAAVPGVDSVGLPADGSYKAGDVLSFTVNTSEAVVVDTATGTPRLVLSAGGVTRYASYVSGTASGVLVFQYTVQAGDTAASGLVIGTTLDLNGGSVRDAAGNDLTLNLNGLGSAAGVLIDTSAPTASSLVRVDGSPGSSGSISYTLTFSENVSGVDASDLSLFFTGTASASIASVTRIDGRTYTVVVNGIAGSGSLRLDLNGSGTGIMDTAGNAIVGGLTGASYSIDQVAPGVVDVDVPADGSYKAGDVLSFTVNTGEGVVVDTATGTPRLVLSVGGVTHYASYVSGAASGALVFQYTVQAGDTAASGLVVGTTLDLNGGSVRDAAGNNLALALNGLDSTAGVRVDTTAPTASGIVLVDPTPANSSTVSFTVTFSENVSGVDVSDLGLFFTGTAAGSIASVTQVDGRTYTVAVNGIGGSGSLRLDLNASGTGINDAAGNALTGGLTGASYSVDRVAPAITSVAVPAGGTYVAGQNLDFMVNFSETVQVNTTGGIPRLEVTLDTGGTAYATYLSGSGTNALVFRLTVASGQLDTNGISVGNSLQLNGSTLRDAIGNNVATVLNGLPDTSQVRIDAMVPTVTTVGLPTAGAYNTGDVLRFTVNVSETVNVDTSTGTPRVALTLGGVTRYATYVSGSGSNALVFEYTVQAGNNAAGGIGLPGTLDLNGGAVRDAAGNALNLALNTPGVVGGVVIDTVAPQVSDIVRVDLSPTSSGSVRYTVTFDESVSGVDNADFALVFSGSASGRIASVEQVNGRTYLIVVDNLSGVGNVRLDLNSSATGIVDAAGNLLTGGLQGSSYSIDRVAPSITGVDVPASGTYVAGQSLNFTVRTNEAVLVDSGDGNPRLAISLDNGTVVYADYLSGSGGTALVFRLNVTSGMAGNTTFAVAPSIDLNGGSIRDARGNDANTGLNNVGDTRGILVDARAPRPSSIVVDGPVQPGASTLTFTLTFDEAVSGVDLSDFSVISTGSASGAVQAVQQLDATTYRVIVGNMSGAGALALSLSALNSGIRDQAGNDLARGFDSALQTIQSQDIGDLNYRINPPDTLNTPQAAVVQPQVPGLVVTDAVSPLVAPGLFDIRTVGGNLQPLGTIFLGNGSSAPSFIAQVFGSSAIGSSQGGFGGREGGLLGSSSTFASIFSREVPGVSEMNVFDGDQWKQSDLNQGARGVFGAPTLGQQLQQINEADRRHVRELAKALAQSAQIGKRA